MDKRTFQFLDDIGTKEFITVIKEITEKRLNDSISNEINGSNVDDTMPTAKTVLELVNQVISIVNETAESFNEAKSYLESVLNIAGVGTPHGIMNLRLAFITGDIEKLVTNPDKEILYFQQDDVNDTKWDLYIYADGKWRCVGSSEYDVLDYWSKDNDDLVDYIKFKFVGVLQEQSVHESTIDAFDNIEKKE